MTQREYRRVIAREEWNRISAAIEATYKQIRPMVEQFEKEHSADWEVYFSVVNYPPEVWLRFRRKPVANRSESIDDSLTPKAAWISDDEANLCATFAAQVAEKAQLWVKRDPYAEESKERSGRYHLAFIIRPEDYADFLTGLKSE